MVREQKGACERRKSMDKPRLLAQCAVLSIVFFPFVLATGNAQADVEPLCPNREIYLSHLHNDRVAQTKHSH